MKREWLRTLASLDVGAVARSAGKVGLLHAIEDRPGVDISQLWTPSLRVGSAREVRQQQTEQQEVSFQWKNPDFLFRNPGFLLRNPDFLLKNVGFMTKQEERWTGDRGRGRWSSQLKILVFVVGVLQAAGVYSGWLGGETLSLLARRRDGWSRCGSTGAAAVCHEASSARWSGL